MDQQGQVKEQKKGPGSPGSHWGSALRGMFFPPSAQCRLPPLPHPIQTCFLQQLEKNFGGILAQEGKEGKITAGPWAPRGWK